MTIQPLDRSVQIPLVQTMSDLTAHKVTEIGMLNRNPGSRGLSTGIAALDSLTESAFIPRAVVCIAGYSGEGKTTFTNQLAVAFSSQVWTHVISLEDDPLDAVTRMVANVGRLDVAQLRRGYAGQVVPLGVDEAIKTLGDLPISWSDRRVSDIYVLAAAIRSVSKARGGSHGVVFVDQLSHVRIPTPDHPWAAAAAKMEWPAPPAPSAPEHKQLEWAVEFLQAVAVEYGVTIVLAHQLNNQSAEGEEPTLRSIRGSQGIVHKCESVFVVWNPSTITTHNTNPAPGQPKVEKRENSLGEAWLIGLKQRKGKRGWKVPLTFLGEHQVFVERSTGDQGFSLPPARSEKAQAAADELNAFYAMIDAESLQRLQPSRRAAVLEQGEPDESSWSES